MDQAYDVAVIGAGAMGSAAAYHLSKTGKKVIVFDKYFPPHSLGSSYGESRIIREAYFESPKYVPLVKQAYELWNELEKESNRKLFLKTGGLMIGNRDRRLFQGASRSAILHHVPYEFLTSDEIKKRFPAFKPDEDTVALLEEHAGILFPEECIRVHLELAKKNGVVLHFDESVQRIENKNGRVEIVTGKEKFIAGKVIVSAGAWIGDLLRELQLPLKVKRQVLFWFKCSDEDLDLFRPENFPIYIWEIKDGRMIYGFPDLGAGIKIAIHHEGKLADANALDRTVSSEEIEELTEIFHRHFNATVMYDRSAVCMYTNTPDEDFIIDFHPQNKNIIIASACSGHGFKFASAIGKILCDMASEHPLSFDISVFNLARLMD